MNNVPKIETTKWSSKAKRNKTSTIRFRIANHTDNGVNFELSENTNEELNAVIVGQYLSITPSEHALDEYEITVNAKYRGNVITSKVLKVDIDNYTRKRVAIGFILGLGVPVVAAATAGVLVTTISKKSNSQVNKITNKITSLKAFYEDDGTNNI